MSCETVQRDLRCFFLKPAAVLTLFLSVLVAAGCSFFGPELQSAEGQIMGTWYHVKWSDEGIRSAPDEVRKGILEQLQEVDILMSTYKQESELSQFNQSAVNVWFPLSEPTAEVFDIARRVSRQSGGAFDVTVGKLVNMWGFGPQFKPTKVPSDKEITHALQEVGFEVLELDVSGRKVRKTTPVYVDLSAVAKGYAVDRVALYLESLGVKAYMVEVGGEVRTRGVKPDGVKWRIAIESPVVGERRVQDVLELKDMGLATSGDYRNFYEEGGIRYSHTIDPRTGKPIKHNLASVTVLNPSVGYADAWATAMMVLGEEQGFNVAVEHNMAVLFLVKDGDGFKEMATPGFKQLTGMPKE
ncbi:FAD:protein FMN transferase [Hahella ganghwensis]|uniref:FAD:protein FMN transferase n=1 Tax=Hahella ganghwensis TaxID=286420 RepID=UPI00039DC208|nr:FAD:protein FMN transferase [Hahella ganghwensis]